MSEIERPAVEILGSKVHDVLVPEAVLLIEEWIRQHREDPSRRTRFVVASGFHALWEGHLDPQLRGLLARSDLWLPDGIAPVLISRLRGGPRLRGRAPGPELFRAFLARSREAGWSNYLYGDAQSTLDSLAARLPAGVLAGTWSPPFRAQTSEEHAADLARIEAADPDVLWIGLGCPKQERWIAERLEQLRVPVAIGVGAAFRFEAGLVERAPGWLGRTGFEWVYRLLKEPRKMWRRSLVEGPKFISAVLREGMTKQRTDSPTSVGQPVEDEPST